MSYPFVLKNSSVYLCKGLQWRVG